MFLKNRLKTAQYNRFYWRYE